MMMLRSMLSQKLRQSIVIACFVFGMAFSAQADSAWTIRALSLPDTQGQKHKVADWKGKVILLNFWATWCLPCQTEIAHLKDFQKQNGAKGLQVVGIALDDARKVQNFARSLSMNYPVLIAAQAGPGMLADWGNPQGEIPYTVIIDREGNIQRYHHGELDESVFKRFVTPLL